MDLSCLSPIRYTLHLSIRDQLIDFVGGILNVGLLPTTYYLLL